MADNKSLVAAAAEAEKISGRIVDYLIVNGVYMNLAEHFLAPREFIGKEELLATTMIQSLKSMIKKVIVISTGLADRDMAEKSEISFSLSYTSTKAAVNIVMARCAAEVKDEGIIKVALSPGFVNTSADKPTGGAITPAMQQRFGIMLKDFASLKADFNGPIQPAQSVGMERGVIADVTIEQSGGLLSHPGDHSWL